MCNKFHCFHNGQTLAPFFSFTASYRVVSEQPFLVVLVNELFMSRFQHSQLLRR